MPVLVCLPLSISHRNGLKCHLLEGVAALRHIADVACFWEVFVVLFSLIVLLHSLNYVRLFAHLSAKHSYLLTVSATSVIFLLVPNREIVDLVPTSDFL